jgi:serine/threonine protein kinase
MTPERWQQVEEVLQAALDRPAEERADYLDEACDGDAELKAEAVSLITAHDEAGDFIEQPVLAEEEGARVILHHQPDVNIGRAVGPYRIVRRLGAGGMGEVYLAEDDRLGRLVALKILLPFFASDDARLRRFHGEARAASALNHPNILTIHEVGESGSVHFIATEFIDGRTLRELIEEKSLSLEEILDIAIQIASALAAAHAAGIVHRDIKPENIMRRADGILKLLDFGIAKLMEPQVSEFSSEATRLVKTQTETGVLIGTVGYMSPEQARALQVDERTDIWSLGCVLYEMLAGGRAPFAGATRLDTLVAVLEREPAPLFQSKSDSTAQLEQLQRVVNRALSKDRSERYQSVTEMLSDLKSISHGLELAPVQAKQELRPSRYLFKALMVATLLIAVAVGGVSYWNSATRRGAGEGASGLAAIKLYTRMSETEQLDFIERQEEIVSSQMGERRTKLNEEALRAIKSNVDAYVARLDSKSDRPGSEDLRLIYARAQPYVPLIARSFAARRVPLLVGIYLPMIESEYKACFENSAGAKGLFQFMPQTARQYGVAHEEMCDVEKMTPAAAHYIADRMAELGDDSESMTLVLLSYNRGPEWVRNTLRQLRETDNYERNFWTLFIHRDQLDEVFRNENAGYVPKFFAAAIIGENPQAFDLRTPPLSSLTAPNSPTAKP